MKILFLNPPSWIQSKIHQDMNAPLGLLYLAAVLEKSGYEVKVVDAECLRYTWEDLREKLRSEMPDIVGVTSTTFSYMALRKTVKIARETLPNSKILIGGPHVTALPLVSLVENPDVDVAVIGEGEQTIVEVMKAIEQNQSPPMVDGIAFRHNSTTFFTSKRMPIQNLDSIPFPARHLLEPDMNAYRGNEPLAYKPEPVMLMSRGCPHRCVFCSSPVFGHQKTRYRTPKNIVDEIEQLHEKYGVRSIFIYDDETVGMSDFQNNWVMQVCDEIISRGLNGISYKCQGRCSPYVKLEVFKKMKEAGFNRIMFGVESGSQKVLDAIKKDITLEGIVEAFRLTRLAGIKSLAFVMVGNLSETQEDVEQTKLLLRKIKPDYVQVNVATPLPSSELWDIAIAKNWISVNDFSKYYMINPVSSTDWMSPEEMVKMKRMLEFEGLQFTVKTGIKEAFESLDGLKRLPQRVSRLIKILFAKGEVWKDFWE